MIKSDTPTLALRVAGDADARVIRRLAELDDSRPLRGEMLLAVLDGEAVAALSLADGRVVANPFVRTADAVVLLQLRAAQLSARASRSRRRLRLVDSPRYPNVMDRAA
jgi:hypothetical protein